MSNTFARFLHAYGHPGASQASVDSFKQKRGVNLPDDFEEFLLRSDGCNGELGEGYLQLWSVGELIGADDYEFFSVRPEQIPDRVQCRFNSLCGV